MNKNYDAIIIGTGVIGAAINFELSDAGLTSIGFTDLIANR